MTQIQILPVRTGREKRSFLTFPWRIYKNDPLWVPPILQERAKGIVVPPEYWDTGVALLLFDEMIKRGMAKGYQWADLSLTGENNEDTRPLAMHAGAQVYKRYRFYRKEIA